MNDAATARLPAALAPPAAPDPPALLLAAEDVARRLGISKSTVWRFCDRGILPRPVRLGGLVRWRAADLEAWVRAGCPGLAS